MKVLLLGSTGAVGRGCLDALANRADPGLEVRTARVDVTDRSAVVAAATGCDVVVNCAGPSQRFSAQVAEAVIAAGVPYVDPGGDQVLLDRLAAAEPAVPVLLQAGVQPGLSGLLLRALARDREVDEITAWCGGLQPLTRASVLEYLASLHDTSGHPGAALCDGVIRRIGHPERKPAPAQYFPDSVTARPHLDAETVAVAARLGIGNVLWLNVFDGVHTTRAMQLLAFDDKNTDLDAVLAAAKLDLFGRRPYFAIVAEARHGHRVTATAAFSCPDSYRSTGALAAFAARHVTDLPAGVHPFCGTEQLQQALDFLTQAVPEARVTIVENALTPLASELIEEGSL